MSQNLLEAGLAIQANETEADKGLGKMKGYRDIFLCLGMSA